MNYRELLDHASARLEEAGVPDARLDAWYLLEFCTGLTRAAYYRDPDAPAGEDETRTYQSLVEKRAQRIPLQQITRQAVFMGYEFSVDERVLIPRQDTETVCEAALEKLSQTPDPKILDLCTGSGCILISLLLERPDACGDGTDLSPGAIEVAEKNAGRLGAGDRCRFYEGDLFSALAPVSEEDRDGHPAGNYDMIISNPPYIASPVIETLDPEVRDHDPRIALDGGADGLSFYRKISEKAAVYLKTGGWIVFEIGHDQGKAVENMLREAGFTETEVRKDLGGLDRAVLGRYSGGKKNV